MKSTEAIKKLLEEYNFETVLDIGCGGGEHSEIFGANRKKVTAIDYGSSVYFKKNSEKISTIVADFNEYQFNQKFDCIWCSHVLEHQLNVQLFLRKIYSLLNDNGVLALTVPPAKSMITGGHISFWNAGLLMYNLILAGFDCRYAKIKQYDYNLSIIVQKGQKTNLDNLEYDMGDIKKLKKYLPNNISYINTRNDVWFEGNIKELNWDNQCTYKQFEDFNLKQIEPLIDSHIKFNILGIKISIKRKSPKIKYSKFEIKNILKQICENKKNYLYLDWYFGKYVLDSITKADYKSINLIKFSLFDIFNCKNRFELWELMNKDKSCIEKLVKNFKNKKIDGFIVTLDWNEHHQRIINAFKQAGIPTVCIVHEAVFQDENLYYGSKKPISDLVLTWGDMTKNIFEKRGLEKEKIKIVGSIKLTNYKNYKPIIDKKQFIDKLNLDINKKTILYCCQLCDIQWGDQDFALEKQRNIIVDLIDIAEKNDYNLIIRNAPAHPEKILPTEFRNNYKNKSNIAFDGLDIDGTYKSQYVTKAEDSVFFSDIVLGMNTTMQVEATIINKPALIIKYFDFNTKWNTELGLPVCHNKNELEKSLTEYINSKSNLADSNLYLNFCKNYGFSNVANPDPLKEIEKILSGGVNV